MEAIKNLLNYTFFGNTLLQYLLVFLVVILSMGINRLLGYFIKNRLKKWAKKTKFILDDLLIEAINKPLSFLIFVIAFYMIITILYMPEALRNIAFNALQVLVAINIAYFIIKLTDVFVDYLTLKVKLTKSKFDDQLLPIIKKSIKFFIIILAGVVIIDNLNYDVKSILAGLGIGGLAFALAGKDIIANFFGSITIFADRPFQVGDRVIVEGFDGPVESIGLRSTRIRTLDGTLVTVPNSKMANTSINNIQKRPYIRCLTSIGVTYDTGFEKMKKALEILRNIMKKSSGLENYWIYFNEFGSHSLDILVIYWCKHTKYQMFLEVQEKINLEILKRFDEEKIEFAFPTQTVYLKSDQITPAPHIE